jgi:flagellar capping protein FliD
MTIDERIEGLTQSLEWLASLHRDSEVRNRDNEAKYEARFSRMMDVIERLARLVENHEHRINGLEDQR